MNGFYEIERKIFVDDYTNRKEYQLIHQDKNLVEFFVTYHQVKTGDNFTVCTPFTYKEALELARRRAKDGRYRNYQFLIEHNPEKAQDVIRNNSWYFKMKSNLIA